MSICFVKISYQKLPFSLSTNSFLITIPSRKKHLQLGTRTEFIVSSFSLLFCFCFVNVLELSPIYESINFDAPTTEPPANGQCSHKNKLQRQSAVNDDDDEENGFEPIQARSEQRDLRTFFNDCIPPPPVSSPPHDENDVNDDDSDSDSPQISQVTFEKLDKLYEMQRFVRESSESIYNELYGCDVEFRRAFDFKDYSNIRKRGSSKTLCSLFSVYSTFHTYKSSLFCLSFCLLF